MRKALTAAIAAITLGGAVVATATPAAAEHYRGGGYYGGHDYRRDNSGAAVAAGVIGLALGAALASNANNHGYYERRDYGYDRGYYPRQAYAYGERDYDDYPTYRTCVTTRWVWDPYIGRRVPVESRYAC